MLYIIELKDYVRVDPKFLKYETTEAVYKALKEKYTGKISKEYGIVITVLKVKEIGEGKIIPEDGAVYYPVRFEIVSYIPELNELVYGIVSNVMEYGAFLNLGVIDGFVHISQVMDDYVSYSKDGTLSGKQTKRVIKVGDIVRARIIAISYKDPSNPKIALTMRQAGLGKPEWYEKQKK